jgi:hypothetical protein
MERLIDNDLIYGGLVEINQPHMIARYNHALEAFGFPPTKREAFAIDATGYSPEIAADLKDEQYLDPHGVNRRFIILTPAQASQPVVHINFSSTPDLMRRFFKENAEAIKILTLKDVIYGEIEDSTYRVDDIADILSIKQVRFSLRTQNRLLEKSQTLTELSEQFLKDKDAWADDGMINTMLDLARECGDTRFNNLVPRHVAFEQRSFWTRHFGGIYVFHDDQDPVIVAGWPDKPAFKNENGATVDYIPLSNQGVILDYLTRTERIEPVNLAWLTASGILEIRHEIYTRLAYAKDNPKATLKGLDDMALQNWIFEHSTRLKKDETFNFLSNMSKAVLNRTMPALSDLPAGLELMAVRANPAHPDAQMVNRFLSEYVPFDFLTRFIVNKLGFYNDYETFSGPVRDYAVDFILRRYFTDKQAVWERLFETVPEPVDQPAPRGKSRRGKQRRGKPRSRRSRRSGPWGERPGEDDD